jgi:signal transduction histidine kinase
MFPVGGKNVSKLKMIDIEQKIINDTLLVTYPSTMALVYHGKCIKTVDINRPNTFSFSMIKNQQGYWFLNDENLLFSKTLEDISKAKILHPEIKFAKIYEAGSTMLAATINQGIYKINKNFTIEKLFSEESIPSSRQITLFSDNTGNWWIGTELNGLYYVRKKFLYTIDKSFGLQVTNTYPILRASDGAIWIGQNPGFLKIYNGKIYDMQKESMHFNAVVWGLTEDKYKNIWVASNGSGLFRVTGNSIKDLTQLVAKETGYNFFSIYKDSKNRIWTGSVGAVSKYENGKFTFFDPLNDKKNIYRNILEDKDGVLWFASDYGLIKYSEGKFKLIDSIDARSARALYIDKKNRLWIGTYGNGIRVKINNKFVKLRYQDGLFSDIVSAIAEDFKGNFWFTCNNGIFRIREDEIDDFLSGKKNSVTSLNYGNEEGLENIEFNGGCQPNWMRDKDGNLWFPSFSGPVIVDVNAISSSHYTPKVLIENLVYKNKQFYPGDKIKLPSDYTNFTINIIAPSYSSPSNVRFEYRLLGNSDEWVEIGNKREIVFQKLPYGDYEFQIMVSDSYGNKSSVPASIKFTVESKFFETPSFYILLSLTASSIFLLLLLLRLKIARRVRLRLENTVEERTRSLQSAKEEAERIVEEEKILRAKAEEENRQKLELLRIVSHDLKNPISAIQGFTEMLLEDGDLSESDKNIVTMLDEASVSMVELISQLLNFSRFEGERFRVMKSKILVKDEVDKIVERFRNQSAKKDQTIIKDYQIDESSIFVDGILFSQIVENLLSNAVKYSQRGKEIIVKLRENGDKIIIGIKDSGQGFSEADKADLYKPFVKLSATPTAGEISSGLGLAIVKKFVELNEGTIQLESEKGVGSEFTVEFKKC